LQSGEQKMLEQALRSASHAINWLTDNQGKAEADPRIDRVAYHLRKASWHAEKIAAECDAKKQKSELVS